MKFQLLPIGARFEYEGKIYVKTGPIAAASEQGGQRMIPRYAVLRPVDGAAPVVAPRPTRSLDEFVVRDAFDAFHATCNELLEGLAGEGAPLEAARQAMDKARQDFLAALANGAREA